ncbi:hypothetical protein OS493_027289, partial [Desmophyllum pertusum]
MSVMKKWKVMNRTQKNIQDLTDEVMTTFALQHPIMFDKYNICEIMFQPSKLSKFTIENAAGDLYRPRTRYIVNNHHAQAAVVSRMYILKPEICCSMKFCFILKEWFAFARFRRYGATYRIFVQSMPSFHKNDTNIRFKDIKVPGKCQFPENTNSSECCSIINITAEYSEKKIHLKWLMPLQDQCQEIKTFIIHWNNIQKPEECHGYKIIKGKYEYIIALEKEECAQFNYSIKLSGKINETETKVFTETVLIPQKKTLPPTP